MVNAYRGSSVDLKRRLSCYYSNTHMCFKKIYNVDISIYIKIWN